MKGQFSESLGSVGLYARKNYAHKGLHYTKPGGIEAPVTIPFILGEIEVGIVYLWYNCRAIALPKGSKAYALLLQEMLAIPNPLAGS
jgi:hypothetical protein